MYYGEEVATNNKAEARALDDLMQWLATNSGELGGAPALVVYGDS